MAVNEVMAALSDESVARFWKLRKGKTNTGDLATMIGTTQALSYHLRKPKMLI